VDKSTPRYFLALNPHRSEKMMFKHQLIITTACLLLLSFFCQNYLGVFGKLASVDAMLVSANKSAASRGKNYQSVVFKKGGGSLYTIAMRHYQKANETLFDLIVQANPFITNVRQIGDDQKIILPAITPESYIFKINDGEYRVYIGTFETFDLAVQYSRKFTAPEKLLFIESQEFSPKDTWYRLTMGDYQSREEALKRVINLKEASLIYIPIPLK